MELTPARWGARNADPDEETYSVAAGAPSAAL